jgi:uncharacterized protein
MNSGIPDEALYRILAVLAEDDKVERIILYGSRAKGNFELGSDIDLAIDGPLLDLRRLSALEARLDDLLLPWKIDLTKIGDIESADLLDHIARVGKTLFERA